MRKDLTEIVMVVDRSGSMQSMRSDAEGGINAMIDEQKRQPGDANFTLCQFDTEYEFVHRGTPIKDVGHYSLSPRGGTALLDAVGRAINETGERLSKLDESRRPGLVVFVIVTDGHENASKEFTLDQVKSMTKLQAETYNWQFMYLGANQDAFSVAQGMGIQVAGDYAADKAKLAYSVSSAKVANMRACTAAGTSFNSAFTSDELKSMK